MAARGRGTPCATEPYSLCSKKPAERSDMWGIQTMTRISLRSSGLRLPGGRKGRRVTMGGCDAGPQMVETRPAQGVDGVRCRSFVCGAAEGGGAAGGGGDAGLDRGREEGGQAFVLFGA